MPVIEDQEVLRLDQPGGMDQRHRSRPGSAEYIENMRLDPDGVWHTMGGSEVQHASHLARYVHSIHWFSQHGGARSWVVFERNDASTGVEMVASGWRTPFVEISSARQRPTSPTVGTQYMEHGSWLYAFNPREQPIRWQGGAGNTTADTNSGTVRVGFDTAPPAPHVTGNVNRFDHGATNYEKGTGIAQATYFWDPIYQRGVGYPTLQGKTAVRYGYAMSWVNDLGHESPLSPVTYVSAEVPELGIVTPYVRRGKKQLLLEAPPPPAHVRGVRIYRTANLQFLNDYWNSEFDAGVSEYHDLFGQISNAPLYFHSEYPAAGPVYLIDEVPDSELGAEVDPDQMGLFPPGVAYAAKHRGRLYVAGMPGEPGTLRYSVPGFIEQMPPNNYLPLSEAGAGDITGMVATRGYLVVATRTAVFLVDEGPGGPTAVIFSASVGHMASRAMVEVPEQGVLLWNPEGPYLLRTAEFGSAPMGLEFVGANVSAWFKAHANLSAWEHARACVRPSEREVWVQFPIDGELYANAGLVYHYDIGEWSVRTAWPISCMAWVGDHRRLMVYGTWDTASHPGVYVQHNGALTMNGTTITGTYQVGWLRFPHRMVVVYLQPWMLTYGESVTAQWQRDRRTGWEALADDGYTTTDSEYARPVWDTDTWSATALWGDQQPVPVRMDPHNAWATELTLRVQGTRLGLVSVDTMVKDPTPHQPKLTQVS